MHLVKVAESEEDASSKFVALCCCVRRERGGERRAFVRLSLLSRNLRLLLGFAALHKASLHLPRCDTPTLFDLQKKDSSQVARGGGTNLVVERLLRNLFAPLKLHCVVYYFPRAARTASGTRRLDSAREPPPAARDETSPLDKEPAKPLRERPAAEKKEAQGVSAEERKRRRPGASEAESEVRPRELLAPHAEILLHHLQQHFLLDLHARTQPASKQTNTELVSEELAPLSVSVSLCFSRALSPLQCGAEDGGLCGKCLCL